MGAASDVLLGTHDFRSFCRRKPGTSPELPIMRRVTRAKWSLDEGPELQGMGPGRLLRFEIEANSFCHQMVRSVVGSLVEVGRGQGNAASLLDRLRAVNRHRAADPAPAQGLCLVSVQYG
jgi:tRNA pseudouridine38-40 synthase